MTEWKVEFDIDFYSFSEQFANQLFKFTKYFQKKFKNSILVTKRKIQSFNFFLKLTK